MRSVAEGVLLVLFWVGWVRVATPAVLGDGEALTAAVHNLCPREVALLGESATHGDGHTEAFKVALVERLVKECGFDSVIFEASHYEFLHIAERLRKGLPVGVDDLGAAVGGLWKFDREFAPLLPFLLAKARAGQMSLGGMDDQLAEAGQSYANDTMVAEFASALPPGRREPCREGLHRRVYSEYTAAMPYSAADEGQISGCLVEEARATAMDRALGRAERNEREEEIAAVQRWLGRDFLTDAEQMVGRDRSMFREFTWLRRQRPRRGKVVVWAATVHVAKEGDPAWGDHAGANFGLLVHRKYGGHAFALGFAAGGGAYRQGRREVHAMPAAPAESLEAEALRGSHAEAVFLGPARLRTLGTVPGAVFRHRYETLPWAEFADGIVVFRAERPPDSTR